MKNVEVWGLIPARLSSSRLPEKALQDLHGMPMVVHVARRASLATNLDHVVVCTDSDAIAAACLNADVKVCMTPSDCANGTERIYLAASRLGIPDHDLILDIQGDEPLVDPLAINQVVDVTKENISDYDIVLPHLIGCPQGNKNYVKVVCSGHQVLYLSRADLPFPFGGDPVLKKHLSVIGFSRYALERFYESPQGALEKIEGVELLRALETGLKIYTFPVDGDTFSVDVQEDLDRARRALLSCNYFGKLY